MSLSARLPSSLRLNGVPLCVGTTRSFFAQSCVEGHSGCFRVSAIGSGAAVIMGSRYLLDILVSNLLHNDPEVGLLGLMLVLL